MTFSQGSLTFMRTLIAGGLLAAFPLAACSTRGGSNASPSALSVSATASSAQLSAAPSLAAVTRTTKPNITHSSTSPKPSAPVSTTTRPKSSTTTPSTSPQPIREPTAPPPISTPTGPPIERAPLGKRGQYLQLPQLRVNLPADNNCRDLRGSAAEVVNTCATSVGFHGTVTGTTAASGHTLVASVWAREGDRAVQTLTAGSATTGSMSVTFASSDIMGDGDTKLLCLQLVGSTGQQRVTGVDVVGSQGALLFHISTGARGNVSKAPGPGLYAWIRSGRATERQLIQYISSAWRVTASVTLPADAIPRLIAQGLVPARHVFE